MTTRTSFTERLSLADAWAWLDALPEATACEPVALHQAFGRVLAAPLTFAADRPERDVALIDGYALNADGALGAGAYNPLFLTLVGEGARVTAGRAHLCRAGEAAPPGADAVAPLDVGEAVGAVLEVCAPVARGAGLARRGEAARRGGVAIPAGRRLEAAQIALAASLGAAQVIVRRRPVVALVLAGAKPPAIEALGAALAALVERDGGAADVAPARGGVTQALAGAAAADVVLLIGRSGRGEDDDAARAVEAAGGRIDRHRLAASPGGSAGLGRLGEAPLLLLPGDPLSALATYELLAGRLVRRFAGRPSDWPYPVRPFALSRKIASPIGVAEWAPVVCRGSTAEPLALAPADGLVGYARADGFLVVPAGLEGYAAGERVDVVAMCEPAATQEKP
jgi:molybdopterin molybdotransferase